MDNPAGPAPDWTLEFPSSTENVRQALNEVHAYLGAAPLPADVNDTAQIILAEVLNNIVEHAYGFEQGHPITLSLTLHPDGLWAETLDEGLPMPNGVPPNGVMPTLDPSTPSDLPEGGFGWAMVRELTDQIAYQRNGVVNALRFLIPAP